MKNHLIELDKTSTGIVNTSRFDPSLLRLSQNFIESTGVKKLVTTIPVRKPSKQDFIRVHPEYSLETLVLELKEDREIYLVAPELRSELSRELTSKVLFAAINRQKVLFIWPIKLPGEDSRIDGWSSSALGAANIAENEWIRLSANFSLGGYEVYQAKGELSPPDWPDLDFDDILNIAFKDRYIDSFDHPVLRHLRGEI